jgi:RNA polymerase sigma-70 factor (ECF subfamily)
VTSTTFSATIAEQVPGLLRYARTLTPDPAMAEDLVQETVARGLARADTFRADSSPATWLHSILHNLAVDQLRARRELPVEDMVAQVEARWQDEDYTVDVEQVVARAQTAADLRDALVHLPVVYRSAVLLHDAEGMTAAQVAAVQSISLPAAKQRLRRGRMMLVTELGRTDERAAARRGVPLRCWDARSAISDYLDGELAPGLADQVLRHLSGCPTCPPLYAALVATTGALADQRAAGAKPHGAGRDPDSVVPPGLAERLSALLDRPA